MRELFWGPKRFSELRADLSGLSANVLTQRLAGLEAAGIVMRRKLPPPASVQVYDLTAWGRECEPIFLALARWAARSPSYDLRKPVTAAALLLSLRTMFDARSAKGVSARIGFDLGRERFLATVDQDKVTIAHDDLDDADVIFVGAPQVIASALYGKRDLAMLEAGGTLSVSGNRRLAKKFLTWFPLPAKAV